MNPGVLFLPVYRASTTAYVLGVVLLAALDASRLAVGIPLVPAFVPMMLIWYFVFSLHANRRRHAGKSIGLAALPVGMAVLGKFIGSFVGMGTSGWSAMTDYAAANGVDTEDMEAFATAINDPGFQRAFEEHLQSDPALVEHITASVAWSSYWGFWLVVLLFAIWFARMKKPGGSLQPQENDSAPPADPPSQPGQD